MKGHRFTQYFFLKRVQSWLSGVHFYNSFPLWPPSWHVSTQLSQLSTPPLLDYYLSHYLHFLLTAVPGWRPCWSRSSAAVWWSDRWPPEAWRWYRSDPPYGSWWHPQSTSARFYPRRYLWEHARNAIFNHVLKYFGCLAAVYPLSDPQIGVFIWHNSEPK